MIGVPQVDTGEMLWAQVENLMATISLLQDSIRLALQQMDEMKCDIKLIKSTLHNSLRDEVSVKMKILNPKSFNGTQSAKDLENFLWEMELQGHSIS